MKILIHRNNKEFIVDDTKKFKEHLKALIELINIYEDTQEEVVFQVPKDLIKKT